MQCSLTVPLQQDWLVVYGTLMRQQRNHHWLAAAVCHGPVRLAGFDLHDLGPFPMAVPGNGMLHGELYQLDAATLRALDVLEGAPRLYRRWRVRPAASPWAWLYVGTAFQVRHSPRLMAGRWPGGGRRWGPG